MGERQHAEEQVQAFKLRQEQKQKLKQLVHSVAKSLARKVAFSQVI